MTVAYLLNCITVAIITLTKEKKNERKKERTVPILELLYLGELTIYCTRMVTLEIFGPIETCLDKSWCFRKTRHFKSVR